MWNQVLNSNAFSISNPYKVRENHRLRTKLRSLFDGYLYPFRRLRPAKAWQGSSWRSHKRHFFLLQKLWLGIWRCNRIDIKMVNIKKLRQSLYIFKFKPFNAPGSLRMVPIERWGNVHITRQQKDNRSTSKIFRHRSSPYDY